MQHFDREIATHDQLVDEITDRYRDAGLEGAPAREEVARYWHEGLLAPERAAWIAERVHGSADRPPAGWQTALLLFYLNEVPPAQGLACCERLSVLLLPLVPLEWVIQLFLALSAVIPGSQAQACQARVLADVEAYARALAEAPDQAGAREALAKSAKEPTLLREMLGQSPREEWLARGWQLVLLYPMVLEGLLLSWACRAAPGKVELPLCLCQSHPVTRRHLGFGSGPIDGLLTAYADALLAAEFAVFSPHPQALERFLGGTPTDRIAFLAGRTWVRDWLEGVTPATLQTVLTASSDEALRALPPPAGWAATRPADWLAYAKARFERIGLLHAAESHTPEAAVWYRQALARATDQKTIGALLKGLAGAGDDAATADALFAYVAENFSLEGNPVEPLRDIGVLARLLEHPNPGVHALAATTLVERSAIAQETGDQALVARVLDLHRQFAPIFVRYVVSSYRPEVGFAERWGVLWDSAREEASYLSRSWFTGRPAPIDPGPLRRALIAAPAGLELVGDGPLNRILPLFDDGVCVEAGGPLRERLAAAKNKPLMETAAAWLAARAPSALEAGGWLAEKRGALRRLVLAGLIGNPDPAVLPLLRARLHEKGNPEHLDGGILDRLEAAGEDIGDLDPHAGEPLDYFAGLAEAHKKKIPAAVTRVLSPEVAQVLAPLGERLAQWMLLQAMEGEGEGVPRLVRQILAFLPPARRADLAELGVIQWTADNGKAANQWLMRFLPDYADERAVNHLAKVVKTWSKGRKTKAVEALQYLCAVPGNYGPAMVRDAMENPNYSDSIVRGAHHALEQVAAARGLSFKDLLDELVPDLGVGPDGLALDLGPYHYRVRILPDLELEVVNEKGKAFRSLPKMRTGEDPDKRGVAENAFKILRKNLKPIAKQQGKRLAVAMISAKTWGLARWRRLFVLHPILNPLAQGLIWVLEDGPSGAVRFRPAEERSLIDLEDNTLELPEEGRVRLVHPVELSEEERAAWKGHLADYEVRAPFEQLDAPALRLTDEERGLTDLVRHRGHVFPYGKLRQFADKWGYGKGSTEDGGYFYDHTLDLDGRYRVLLVHTRAPAWFEAEYEVALDHFAVYPAEDRRGKDKFPLGELPPALASTLLQQSTWLAENGSGYRESWERL